MKSILIKIIFGFCIVFSINACHTFEHQNIFNQNINKSSNAEVLDKKNKYVEHSLYKNLVRKKVTYRNNIVPKFELIMIGGSKQGRYGIFKRYSNSRYQI